MNESLKKNHPKLPLERMIPIDDDSELMSVDLKRLRADKIWTALRPVNCCFMFCRFVSR
jgi:hypothetical protein